MKNKKFFSIGSVFSNFFNSTDSIPKVEEVKTPETRKMTAEEESKLALQILNNIFSNSNPPKNNSIPTLNSEPLLKKNITTNPTSENDDAPPAVGQNKPLPPPFGELLVSPPPAVGQNKPLPPRFDAEYIPKKKTENTDSSESSAPEIKLPAPAQVSERMLEHKRRIAEMERLEKERLIRVHVHSR
jgi:hypothetical protein